MGGEGVGREKVLEERRTLANGNFAGPPSGERGEEEGGMRE